MTEKTSIAYTYKDALYLNITSRCPTTCEFCIKFRWGWKYRSYNLLLPKEPTVQEVVDAAGDPSHYSEIVFCGYGESTYRLDDMKAIALALKKNGAKKIRLNTVGLGNLINGKNIVPDLAQFLDEIHISLNTTDPAAWVKMHHPQPAYAHDGFDSVVQFIRSCVQSIPSVYVTAVEKPGLDKPEFETFVKNLGAKSRFRPILEDDTSL